MDIIQWTKQSSETEKKKRKYQINLLFAEKNNLLSAEALNDPWMTLDNTKNTFLNIHFIKKVLIIWEGVWWCYSMSILQLHLLLIVW